MQMQDSCVVQVGETVTPPKDRLPDWLIVVSCLDG